jgi:magnesium chelatase family protein
LPHAAPPPIRKDWNYKRNRKGRLRPSLGNLAPTGDIERVAAPDAPGAALLADAAVKLQLTARGYHRVLKVARTIADLDGAGGVRRLHIAEALAR